MEAVERNPTSVQIDFVGAVNVPEPKSIDAWGAKEDAASVPSPVARASPNTLLSKS